MSCHSSSGVGGRPGRDLQRQSHHLDSTAGSGIETSRAPGADDDASGVAELRSKGMTVIENIDKAKFVAMLAPVNADFEKQFGKANIDAIRNVK